MRLAEGRACKARRTYSGAICRSSLSTPSSVKMLFQSDAKVSSVLQLTITDFSPESFSDDREVLREDGRQRRLAYAPLAVEAHVLPPH